MVMKSNTRTGRMMHGTSSILVAKGRSRMPTFAESCLRRSNLGGTADAMCMELHRLIFPVTECNQHARELKIG
eukprot:s606_g4.t1